MTREDLHRFHYRVQGARLIAGYKRVIDAAHILTISPAELRKIERGKLIPDEHVKQEIAGLYGFTVEELWPTQPEKPRLSAKLAESALGVLLEDIERLRWAYLFALPNYLADKARSETEHSAFATLAHIGNYFYMMTHMREVDKLERLAHFGYAATVGRRESDDYVLDDLQVWL